MEGRKISLVRSETTSSLTTLEKLLRLKLHSDHWWTIPSFAHEILTWCEDSSGENAESMKKPLPIKYGPFPLIIYETPNDPSRRRWEVDAPSFDSALGKLNECSSLQIPGQYRQIVEELFKGFEGERSYYFHKGGVVCVLPRREWQLRRMGLVHTDPTEFRELLKELYPSLV